jgi:hypothetical protein
MKPASLGARSLAAVLLFSIVAVAPLRAQGLRNPPSGHTAAGFAPERFSLFLAQRFERSSAEPLDFSARLSTFVAASEPFPIGAAADALQQYAQQCDQAVGVTVPDFSCDAGTEVPMTHPVFDANGKPTSCDRPNRLNKQCDPGSRFQVLTRSPSAYVVAHCRREGLPSGRYADIAVIQYNRNSGATCWYQALGNLPGQVKAPSKGIGAWPWLSPAKTADIQCGACHDNGALIRSPYLAQITGPNALPGAGDVQFNRNQPYGSIGSDFASWKAYKVEIAGNTCTQCHRMGTNNLTRYGDGGTALDFGIRATAEQPETQKNPHSPDSPIWMTPGQITFNPASAAAAKAIHDCALHRFDTPLPNTDACRITQFSGVNSLPLDNGTIWEATGVACSGESCPGWQRLDNNSKTFVIAAGGNDLYQLHNDGWIWRYTGTACTGESCPGWQRLDNNQKTVAIAAADNDLYQLHNDGWIWRYTGTPCTGESCPGWQRLDNNQKTVAITAADNDLYQLHNDGWIWRYTGTPCTGESCPGWQRLDNNQKTVAIRAAGGTLYQQHSDGWIWRYTGTPCTGESCPGWQRLDNNGNTALIVAAGTRLFQLHADPIYQLHRDGWIWRYTGPACEGESCPGWQRLDKNPKTRAIAASGRDLYQLHNDGWIWRYTGRPCSGESCTGWQRLDNNPKTKAIAASGRDLYQLHNDGWIWRYTGRPCNGESCPGWQRLDNNPNTGAIAAAATRLGQLQGSGWIWKSFDTPCTGNLCPGWQRLDNNPKTISITIGGFDH